MTRVSAKRLVFAAFIVVLVVLGMTLPVYWVFLLSTVAISALIARTIAASPFIPGVLPGDTPRPHQCFPSPLRTGAPLMVRQVLR